MKREAFIALLVLTLLPPTGAAPRPHHPRRERVPFSLGGLRLGATLDYFRQHFEGAACGTVRSTIINRHTHDDPDDSGYLTCCIDDPNSVAKFSEFKVASIDAQCPVILDFYRENLVYVGLTVESVIERLLPGFEETYGRADKGIERPDLNDAAPPQTVQASWSHGCTELELMPGLDKGDESANDEAHQPRRLVEIDMRIAEYCYL